MLRAMGLVVVSTLLVHCAGTWAYTFFIMLRQGEVAFYEPSRPYLVAEFGMAVAWALAGVFFLVAAILGLKRRADSRSKK